MKKKLLVIILTILTVINTLPLTVFASTTPLSPTNLAIKSSDKTTAKLSWKDPEVDYADEIVYKIERVSDDGTVSYVKDTPNNTHLIEHLVEGEKYTYKVTSYLNGVEGENKEISFKTEYTISYKPNTATGSQSDNLVLAGHDITLPTQTTFIAPAGKEFKGWGKKASSTSVVTKQKDVKKNNVYYAIWQDIVCTATFNSNGGTSITDKTINYNEKFSEPANPTKTGYTFEGWYKDNGFKTTYDFDTLATGDVTLYAKWTPNTGTAYTVIHKQQNIKDDDYTTKDTEILSGKTGDDVTPSLKDYTGFSAPSTQTKEILADGSLIITYLYTRNTYDISFSVDNTKCDVTGTIRFTNIKYGDTITAPTVTPKAGYSFNGWNSTFSATITENKTYTASITANDYTLFFDENGGTGTANDKLVTYSTAIGALPTLTRAGYNFNGWKIGNDVITSTTNWKYAGDKTAVASWSANSLTGKVEIRGDAQNGAPLYVVVTNDNNIGSLQYQWKRDGVNIWGANYMSYTPTEADLYHRLSVTVTSSLQSGYIESALTAVVENMYTPIYVYPSNPFTITETTTLIYKIADINYGQSVTLTAEVQTDDYQIPTGTVLFKDSGVTIGSAALKDGIAKVTVNGLSAGDYKITAQYVCDNDDYKDSVSENTSSFEVKKASITNTTPEIQTKIYTAKAQTITAPPSGKTQGGNPLIVSYDTDNDGVYDDAAPTFIKVGVYTVRYKLSAKNHNDIIDTITFKVSTATPTVQIMVADGNFGDTITLATAVSGVNGEKPTGFITFTNNGINIAGATNIAVVNGVAKFDYKDLPAGDFLISAIFTATENTNYKDASSIIRTLHVGKSIPTFTVPTGLSAVSGEKLGNVKLPVGFTFNDSANTLLEKEGLKEFVASYTPADGNNFLTVPNIVIEILVTSNKTPSINTNNFSAGEKIISGEKGNNSTPDNFKIVMVNNLSATDLADLRAQTPTGFIEFSSFYLYSAVEGTVIKDTTFTKEVTISIQENLQSDYEYKIIHKKQNSSYEILTATANMDNSTLTFKVSELSPFMIVKSNLPKDEIIDTSSDPEKESNPTDLVIIVGLIIIIIGLVTAIFVLIKRKKEEEI